MEDSSATGETFTVRKFKPVLVRPAVRTWEGIYFLSNLDQPMDFVNDFIICFKGDESKRNENASEVMKDALAKVLVEFYPLAGCLIKGSDGKYMVKCAGQGVPFVEALVERKMEELGNITIPDPLKLHKLVHYIDGAQSFLDLPLLTVQVTRFKCGGFVLGLVVNHLMADGISLSGFMNSWAETARGLQLTVPPFLDRSIIIPRKPPKIEFSHQEFAKGETESLMKIIITPLCQEQRKIYWSLHIHSQMLTQLTTIAIDNQSIRYPTNFELIAAIVWRNRIKALEMNHNQKVKLRIAIDVRTKLGKLLPKGYFGNAFVFACCHCDASELTRNSLSFVVKLVQDAIGSVTDDYVRSAIDYIEVTKYGLSRKDTCFISKWTRLPLYNADFGWGGPAQVAPVSFHDHSICYHSRGKDDGDIVVSLCMPVSSMKIFQELMQSELKLKLSNL